ncbi:MAG: hypothetical protein ACFFAJ_15360 [Candidatus Hodarchaeota archaeon]
MKKRSILIYWLFLCVIITIGYILLQGLLSVNLWENIGVIPPPDLIELFSLLGLILYQFSIVGGFSLITGIFVWLLISKLFSPTQSFLKLLFEICQAWICLSVFEGSLILYNSIFSFLIRGEVYTFVFNYQIILNISWINLILVSLFYTLIGFQALRKRLQMKIFLKRVSFDIGQVIVMLFEVILLFLPFGLLDFITFPQDIGSLFSLILIFYYYTILTVLVIEYVWWVGQRIEKEIELSQTDFNSRIFLFQLSIILVPLTCFISFIPYPFFLLIITPVVWFLILLICIFVSFFGVLLHRVINLLTPDLYENVEHRVQLIKYYFDFLLASRGTMFNYPQPVDILTSDKLTEVIQNRWEKVTLKMACGHCYHVFLAKTSKDGTKVKPIPCPFCKSMATTPVWE